MVYQVTHLKPESRLEFANQNSSTRRTPEEDQPSEPSTDSVMNETSDQDLPSEFFDDMESIALIALMNRRKGNIKKEIEYWLGVDQDKRRKLVAQAKEAGLVEDGRRLIDDHGRSERVQLTNRGKAVQTLLRGIGAHDKYKKMRELQKQLNELLPGLEAHLKDTGLDGEPIQHDQWVKENPELNDEELGKLRESIRTHMEPREFEIWGTDVRVRETDSIEDL